MVVTCTNSMLPGTTVFNVYYFNAAGGRLHGPFISIVNHCHYHYQY